MNKKILKKKKKHNISQKKKGYTQKVEQEQATWEEQRDNVQTCRAGLMKAKSPPRAEFGEGKKENVYRYVNSKSPASPRPLGLRSMSGARKTYPRWRRIRLRNN